MLQLLRLRDLQYACNRLYESKYNGEYQNQRSNPEGPPLHRLPIISPPLKRAFWLMAVIRSFEFHEAVSPVLEVLDLAIFQLQMAALQRSWVKRVGLL